MFLKILFIIKLLAQINIFKQLEESEDAHQNFAKPKLQLFENRNNNEQTHVYTNPISL